MSLRYFPILVFNIVDTEANKPYLEKTIFSDVPKGGLLKQCKTTSATTNGSELAETDH